MDPEIIVFTKVVECKSVTGAADALGFPKSTVSRRLAQLEERLGVRLIHRSSRKLALTEIGEAYYARCARIVADIHAAEQLVTDMQDSPRGRLRVSSTVNFCNRYLGRIISRFIAKHRDISVELEATDRLVDPIEEAFDVAVRFGPMEESTLSTLRLCSIRHVLVAAPAYLARAGEPSVIDDLDAHDHVLFAPISGNQSWMLAKGDATHEFGRPARLTSNNLGAVRDLTLDGGGIALLSDFMIGDELASGALVHVLPDWTTRPTDVYAAYPPRRNLPPRLTLFLDHLAKALAPPPWAHP